MEKEVLDAGRERVGLSDSAYLAEQCLSARLAPRHAAWDRLQHDHRQLLAGRAYADQRASENVPVLVEDRLAGDRVHGAVGGQHPLSEPTAIPEPSP